MQNDSTVINVSTSSESTGEIPRAVANLRAATHAAILQRRKARLAVAQQTKQELKSYRAQIRTAAARICLAAKRAMAIDDSSLRAAQPGRPDCEEQKWDFGLEGEAPLPITKSDIMRIIEQHPDGVSIAEIGNELGADWRGLVNWSQRLVLDGKVEKFDDLFYPARE